MWKHVLYWSVFGLFVFLYIWLHLINGSLFMQVCLCALPLPLPLPLLLLLVLLLLCFCFLACHFVSFRFVSFRFGALCRFRFVLLFSFVIFGSWLHAIWFCYVALRHVIYICVIHIRRGGEVCRFRLHNLVFSYDLLLEGRKEGRVCFFIYI